ncbi:hypothetical protein DesyoDRAFT_0744 [Desulfosporosinus youngiae DSM 17734]|uniref:Uncharacterized protein n=1 Tax=Desulfosporosinus youngiae DSM 17734 TaxID=768710 RepID=H5XSV7_9FIRM|nr:hypothetical protein DesyoDRAFT_0744 [Desulfosporosinus youngiae DSM 17734]
MCCPALWQRSAAGSSAGYLPCQSLLTFMLDFDRPNHGMWYYLMHLVRQGLLLSGGIDDKIRAKPQSAYALTGLSLFLSQVRAWTHRPWVRLFKFGIDSEFELHTGNYPPGKGPSPYIYFSFVILVTIRQPGS